MTSTTNPWRGIHRILAGRDKRAAPQTTLKQKDGTLTTNLQGMMIAIYNGCLSKGTFPQRWKKHW